MAKSGFRVVRREKCLIMCVPDGTVWLSRRALEPPLDSHMKKDGKNKKIGVLGHKTFLLLFLFL